MHNVKKVALVSMLIGLAIVGTAVAGTPVTANITTSQTWTKAGSPYHLTKQIYVEPGATLTMEAGTVVASFVADQGSLAVCRKAKIYIKGTKCEPVIMTSAEDVATWQGSVVTRSGGYVNAIITMGDPKTGTWREACNEWGNLTIMGEALISASHYGNNPVTYRDGYGAPVVTNTKIPTGLNKKIMEGLTADAPGDPKVLYGGADDYDDSGCIEYLSIRYGGKVIQLQNELNGLSLGGIGRETDISFVEIMNNVDDGIEIWGGTVNLDHVNIWNIGDDSFDFDEGWRGCAEYGLIVQGYSIDDSQGSGVGDNCLEHDGAEDADAQPMTTAQIKHFTMVGQPEDGDYGCAWRDNARVQYVRCIWMDLGADLVWDDNHDTDGANGYDGLTSAPPLPGDANPLSPVRINSADGTMSWRDTWQTDYDTWANSAWAQVNLGDGDPCEIYRRFQCCCCQSPAKLASITESVFYNIPTYTEADIVGVTNAGGYNGLQAATNVITSTMPIQKLVRGPAVTKGGKTMVPVININPISHGDAFDKGAGGFNCCHNWLRCWTAADAYGMTDTSNSDLNCDDEINVEDFAEFAEDWLLI